MANVIKTHNLFPTAIQEFEYVAEQKLINAIREEEVLYLSLIHI